MLVITVLDYFVLSVVNSIYNSKNNSAYLGEGKKKDGRQEAVARQGTKCHQRSPCGGLGTTRCSGPGKEENKNWNGSSEDESDKANATAKQKQQFKSAGPRDA